MTGECSEIKKTWLITEKRVRWKCDDGKLRAEAAEENEVLAMRLKTHQHCFHGTISLCNPFECHR